MRQAKAGIETYRLRGLWILGKMLNIFRYRTVAEEPVARQAGVFEAFKLRYQNLSTRKAREHRHGRLSLAESHDYFCTTVYVSHSRKVYRHILQISTIQD